MGYKIAIRPMRWAVTVTVSCNGKELSSYAFQMYVPTQNRSLFDGFVKAVLSAQALYLGTTAGPLDTDQSQEIALSMVPLPEQYVTAQWYETGGDEEFPVVSQAIEDEIIELSGIVGNIVNDLRSFVGDLEWLKRTVAALVDRQGRQN